ncbi:MAG TPA: hypothetical protein VFW23_16775, partial [Tepidisphaeraceae bacterium]|nr:hypothetical protein [Tepidisphaeraceae bacterium]
WPAAKPSGRFNGAANMTPGFLSIRSEAGPWNKARLESYLAICAVGVLAGIAVAYGRMPLHLPGHKALLWMAPVLACRLVARQSAAASVGASATLATALLLGGRLAGGITAMPLVIIAGILLDLFAANVERNHVVGWRSLVILTLAGCAANLLCCLKRVFDPSGGFSLARKRTGSDAGESAFTRYLARLPDSSVVLLVSASRAVAALHPVHNLLEQNRMRLWTSGQERNFRPLISI